MLVKQLGALSVSLLCRPEDWVLIVDHPLLHTALVRLAPILVLNVVPPEGNPALLRPPTENFFQCLRIIVAG